MHVGALIDREALMRIMDLGGDADGHVQCRRYRKHRQLPTPGAALAALLPFHARLQRFVHPAGPLLIYRAGMLAHGARTRARLKADCTCTQPRHLPNLLGPAEHELPVPVTAEQALRAVLPAPSLLPSPPVGAYEVARGVIGGNARAGCPTLAVTTLAVTTARGCHGIQVEHAQRVTMQATEEGKRDLGAAVKEVDQLLWVASPVVQPAEGMRAPRCAWGGWQLAVVPQLLRPLLRSA